MSTYYELFEVLQYKYYKCHHNLGLMTVNSLENLFATWDFI